MNRDELVRARGESWKRLEYLVQEAQELRGAVGVTPAELKELSELYRALAGDLMRVQRDKLGSDLERQLHSLAARAHNALYAGTSIGQRFEFLDIIRDFPGALRRNLRFFALATALFYGPFFIGGFAAYKDESYAQAVMSSDQLDRTEKMYEEAPSGRDAGTDATMTGFYVYNNVGIAFRCFATGIAFGLGSFFFLFFNGLSIGVVFGHLIREGLATNILSFVSTHGPWELTAIVISGAAGMQMGWAMVLTRGRTRLGNLQAHGLELLRQIGGAAVFLLLAAVLEAWVSPSSLPIPTKYGLGAVGWLFVATIIIGVGRDRPLPEDVVKLKASQQR